MNYLKQEFEEYKLKATKTLQSKDRLIATLKENASQNSEDGQNSGLSMKSIEIDELKMERDSLKEDLQSKNSALEVLRSEYIDLESQTSVEIEYLKEQIRNLQGQNEGAQLTKTDLELDLKNLRQELSFTHEELSKQKTTLNSKLLDRDAEIEKLRLQVYKLNFKITFLNIWPKS